MTDDQFRDATKMVSPTCFRCNHANMRHTGLVDHTNAAPGRPERRLYQYKCQVNNCNFIGWYSIPPKEPT